MMSMESTRIVFPLAINPILVAIVGSKYKSKMGGTHWYSFLKKPPGLPEDHDTNTVIPAINKMDENSTNAFIDQILTPLVSVIQCGLSVTDKWNIFKIFPSCLFPFCLGLFNDGFITEQVNTHQG